MRGRCVAWIDKWEMKKGERGNGGWLTDDD